MSNLKQVKADLEKKFGINVLRFANEISKERVLRIPTGSIGLDIALGGGYPVGRLIQVAGAFSASKSTTVYHGLANAQKMHVDVNGDGKLVPMQVALIQGENGSWTKEYGEQVGIDTSKLILSESAGMEESLEVAYQLQVNGIAQVIAFDSFASLVPVKERESGMQDSVQMGLKPKLFDEYFRKFQAANNMLSRQGKFPCTLIGINQLREKIGQMHGNPEFTPGGRAIGFTASVDVFLRRGEWITTGTGENKTVIGQQVKFKINKSKVSVPFRTGGWDFYFDEGGTVPAGHIDNFKEIIIEAIAYGVIEKSGAWMKYGDSFNLQGAQSTVDFLRDNLELYEEIKAKTMEIALADYEEVFTDDDSIQVHGVEDTLSNIDETIEEVKKSGNKKTTSKKSKSENSKKVVKKSGTKKDDAE